MIQYGRRSISLCQMNALLSTDVYSLNEFDSDNSWIVLSSDKTPHAAYNIRVKSCIENVDALTLLVEHDIDIIPYLNTYDPVLFSLYLMTVSNALDPFIGEYGSLPVPDWMKCPDALRDIFIIMPAYSSNNSVIEILDTLLVNQGDDVICDLLDEADHEEMEDQIYSASNVLCSLISKLQCPTLKSTYMKKYVPDIELRALLNSFSDMDDEFMIPFIEDTLSQYWDTQSTSMVSEFRPSIINRIVKKLTLLKGSPPKENALPYNSSKYFSSGSMPVFDIKWHNSGLGIGVNNVNSLSKW